MVNDIQLGPTDSDGKQSLEFYDQPAWDPFWTTCVSLNVPFYLHPSQPPGTIYDTLWKDRTWLIGPTLSFAHGVSLQLMGMIVNDFFNR